MKEQELDHTVGKAGVIRSGALNLGFALSAGQVDSANGKDKPAIDVSWGWGVFDVDVDKVHWRMRRHGTTKIIGHGTINNVLDGEYQIKSSVLRFRQQYDVQFLPVPISARDEEWGNWMAITCVIVDVPTAPSLTRVSELANNGQLNFYIDVDWINVPGETTYVVRVTSGAVTRRYPAAHNSRRIPVTSGKSYTIDVAAVINGDVGDFSSSSTIFISKKNTNNDPPISLEVTTNRYGKIFVWLGRDASATDFKRFNIYAAASNNFLAANLLDDTPSSRFEHGDLNPDVDRWYWATTVDQSDNESAKFPSSNTNGRHGSTIRLAGSDLADGGVDETKLGPEAVSRGKIKDRAVDTIKLEYRCITGSKAISAPFKVQAHKTPGVGSLNWSGDTSGDEFIETIVLREAVTIDNVNPSPVRMTGNFNLRNAVKDDGSTGDGKSYVYSTISIQAKKAGQPPSAYRNIAGCPTVTVKCGAKGQGNVEPASDRLNFSFDHRVGLKDAGNWNYRAVLTIIHQRGSGRDWIQCQILAGGSLSLSWPRR